MKRIDIATLSNKGGRENNEDYCKTISHGSKHILALADGLGGHSGGEVASETAVVMALRQLGQTGDISNAFDMAQSAVMEMQQQKRNLVSMRTTLVLAVINEDRLRFGHIGDSRLYVFKNGKPPYRTYDHSVVNVLYKTGKIKGKEIRRHPDRNKLLRVMGEAESFKPEICVEPVQLEAGDAVLMCTDGFWEYIPEKEMKRVLSKSKSSEDWLRGMEKIILKRAKKGHDNYSAIAVKIDVGTNPPNA